MKEGSNDSCIATQSTECEDTLVWDDFGDNLPFNTTLAMAIAKHLEVKQSPVSNFFVLDANAWSITDKPDLWKYHVICQDCNQS